MTTSPWIGAGVAAVLVFWALGAYNRLVRLRSGISGCFVQVHAQIQQRHVLLEQWAEALEPLLDDAPQRLDAMRLASTELIAASDRARTRASASRAIGELRRAEEALATARSRLASELPAQVERLLPSGAALGSGMGLAVLNEELLAADSTLSFARHRFNDAVQDYNDSVLQFPTWVVAGLFRFQVAGTL